jgi:hypothetical protein
MDRKNSRWMMITAVVSFLLVAVSACVPVPYENAESSESSVQDQEGEMTSEDADQGGEITSERIDLNKYGAPITGCDNPQPPWITSLEVLQTPDMPEPQPRVPFRDPVFGTCLVRVTDRNADLSSGDPSGGLKNEYSRVQSFNADGRYLLARSTEANWYLYDAVTLQPLGQLPLDVDPRWSPTDPYLIFFISETSLMSYNIQTGETSTRHDFREDLSFDPVMVWTRYEGSPSADGRYWGLIAQDQDWLAAAYLIYDLELDNVVATRSLDDWSELAREVDSVTISPSGEYFLAYMDLYCQHGVLGSDANPCGLMVYDRNLQNGRGLLRIVGHSDLAFDAQGRDVLVYQDIDTDHISMLDLESGAITPLWSIDFSHSPIGLHFSGRGFGVPGWAMVSTDSGGYPQDYTWMDDQVFAIELKPNGRIVRLAHTHTLVDQEQEHDYWAEAQVTVNQDFTRALFTTNWGRSGTAEVEMYMLYLPEDWLAQLP